MKHLATRIFLAFFAALLLTALGAIAITSWSLAERQEAAQRELLAAAEAAAAALAEGGRPALINWSESRARDARPSLDILVLDEWGEDLLGRSLPVTPALQANPIDDDGFYDFSVVLLDLPREMPVLISAEGEAFRLQAVPRRTGLAAWKDVPMPLLLLALIVTALTSLLLARSITRPVLGLQRVTERLAAGDFASPVDTGALGRRDEIGRLARSLHRMAERLDTLIRGQRQLLRDISHEVRSPLARIRLATGLLVQRDAAAEQAVSRIDSEIHRLDELIEQILDVSRLESGSTGFEHETLDLRAITERILTDAAFEAQQLGKRLHAELTDDPLLLVGDRHWVHSAIENVVRNALRHTDEGSEVAVRLRREDSIAILQVSDSGSGLPENELQKIFEPFYRGRNPANVAAAGTGLGLAIVARVMQSLGGSIAARNRRDADGRVIGLEILLRWPLALTSPPTSRTASAHADRDHHSRG